MIFTLMQTLALFDEFWSLYLKILFHADAFSAGVHFSYMKIPLFFQVFRSAPFVGAISFLKLCPLTVRWFSNIIVYYEMNVLANQNTIDSLTNFLES